MKRFVRPSLWKSRLGRETLLTRLIRRYTAEGTDSGFDSVVQLLKAAPDDVARDTLWKPILQGWRDVPHDRSTDERQKRAEQHEMSRLIHIRWLSKPDDTTLIQLGLALNDPEPFERARRQALNQQLDVAKRVELLGILGSTANIGLVDPLLGLVASDEPEAIRIAALKAVGRIDEPRIAPALISLHQASVSPTFASQIRDVMLGRKETAKAWLIAVDQNAIPAKATPNEQVQKIAFLEDPELDELVKKHWGQLGTSRGEKLAEARRLNNDIRASAGNPAAGHLLFKKHCANCHQLFGEGTKLGPDLTSANRKDREFMLISLVDPSSMIRKEYSSVIVQTRDGRVLTGMAIARDDAGMTLVNAKNEKVTISAGDIDEFRESPVSLMPDDLYRQLKPQELRDLFSYLESNGK